ncbi:MAG: aminotransferase class I/II-fold pyridoxal phosphate-dependent enzyme [Actinomycetota bacterium]|nr:aminotransferase class I/II-fold pyridoxal phosphate-dependent enzyme [Actinomycetota bacterium]
MAEEGFTTRALRAGLEGVDLGKARPVSVPIYQTSTYAFDDAETLAALIRRGKDAGFVYSRWHNPTRAALERVLAGLEGGEDAVAFSSGMAAISTVLLTLAAGGRVVSSPDLYGGTHSMMTRRLPSWGVDVEVAPSSTAEDLAAALRPETSVCYVEAIGNPRISVCDIEALAAACRDNGTALVVDATFASPYVCRPLALGADVVVHSTTKYLGGHHDLTGGAAVGDRDRMVEIRETMIDLGGPAAPLESWLVLRGIQTLALRMERHCANAVALASMLESHPKVSRVWYPGLASHPDHEVATRVLRGFSGMLSFELAGGFDAGRRFQDALEVALVAPSLGGVHTLVVHAASVTHTQLSPEQRRAAGIDEGFVRVSVGIEDQDDLLDDFQRALDKV